MAQQILLAVEPAALERVWRRWPRSSGSGPSCIGTGNCGGNGARYEAERAARQYHACEPENRLVGRELEHCWEEALRQQRQLDEEFERWQRCCRPN